MTAGEGDDEFGGNRTFSDLLDADSTFGGLSGSKWYIDPSEFVYGCPVCKAKHIICHYVIQLSNNKYVFKIQHNIQLSANKYISYTSKENQKAS